MYQSWEIIISRYSNIPIDVWRYIIKFDENLKLIGNEIICITPLYRIPKKIVDRNNGFIALKINDDRRYYIHYYEPCVIRWRNDITDNPRFLPSKGKLTHGVIKWCFNTKDI